MSINPLSILVGSVLLLQACTKKITPENDPRFDGNRKMVAVLDSLAKAADPRINFYLSGRRAARMKAMQPKMKNDLEKLNWNTQYYNELLNAGKTEEAAAGFNYFLTDPKYAQVIEDNKITSVAQLLAVSYLRMGEQKNCVLNHTSESCIVPLKPAGFHQDKKGSKMAIEVYNRILDKNPNDLSSRWLLNIAYMTLGEYPDGVPKKWLVPVSAFAAPKSDVLPFRDRAIEMGMDINGMAGGAIIEDFNNDGYMDVFCTSYGLYDQCHLFLNQKDGSFSDITESAQLTGIVGGLNAKQADYDNDGFMDILILRGAWLDKGGEWPNSLLHNNGDGTFSDVTFAAGMASFRPTETAAWADVNHDGLLDVFIANENNPQNTFPCELWINNGNGTFTDKAAQYGVAGNFGFVKGVNVNDFNNDGRPDIYLSILAGPGGKKLGNNKLFMNRASGDGKDIRFEDVSATAGVTEPYFSFPSAVFDYNNDGYLDIYVTGFDMNRLELCGEDACREYLGMPAVAEMPRLFKNNGNETFTDVTEAAGLKKVTYGMGLNTGDIDNDGWLDIYVGTGAFDFRTLVPNRMFRNVQGKYFEEVTMNGFGHLQKGHGIAFGDLDNDGDQDIYCVMGGAYEGDDAKNILFENPNSNNNWITIQVQGKTVSRDAQGSRIKVNVVDADGTQRSIYAIVGSGATFGANSIQQEIGLGKAKTITSVEVFWEKPGYPSSTYKNLPINSVVKIKEGETNHEVIPVKKTTFRKSNKVAEHQHH